MASDSLDTNCVLRYIIGDVPEQYLIVKKFLQKPNCTHTIEDTVISETVYVLNTQYGKTRQEIIDLLNFFLARFSDTVSYNHALTSLVFPMYLSHPKLSFNDCMLSCYAELHHAEPLFTFDKKLAKQADNAKLLV